MNTTISARPAAVATSRPPVRLGLLGGIGGLVFASSVLVQNALRSKFPTNDAGPAEGMKYYADHRGVTVALAVLMPIGLVSLTTILGAVISRVSRGAARAAALTGA